MPSLRLDRSTPAGSIPCGPRRGAPPRLAVFAFAWSSLVAGWLPLARGEEAGGAPNPAIPTAPALAPLSDFQKGVAFTAWYNGSYSSPRADETLAEVLAPLGVNWIQILALGRQETISSTEIRTDPTTFSPTDDDIAHVVREAHRLGIRVLLKPHVDLSNDPDHWRGEITAGTDDATRAAWFASYSEFISHYAELARTTGADAFAIGTELHGTTRHSDEWRAIAKAVRERFDGSIVYASYWMETGRIDWWDCVDFIGVDAYFPLLIGQDPSVERLAAALAPNVERLGRLSEKWNRPVLFTEIGYRSLEGTHRSPEDWKMQGAVDHEAQANCYEAVFRAFGGKEWFRGVYWWNVNPDPHPGGPDNTDYTPIGKPAEEILRLHFRSGP